MAVSLRQTGTGTTRLRRGPLRDLDHPARVFALLGPNWFASVMGTGIVANAAVTLPLQFTGFRVAATVVWALAALLLVGLSAAWLVHWIRHPATAKGHSGHPGMAQFWGAPPMALTTVGTGTLLLGKDWIGLDAAVTVDVILWTAGAVLGIATTVWIPFRMMTGFELGIGNVFAAWLMPVVPPMVSAATGALLVPHVPEGEAQRTLLFACYAMFGISLFATLCVLPQIWQRLVLRKTGTLTNTPTVWIVLGPLGQSVTAANLLADAAQPVLGDPYAKAADAFGLLYGVPAFGFALIWLALATALTVRAFRNRLPFALTWWSFTFPLGTVVTGASTLDARVHTGLFAVTACVLYAALVGAWATVAVRTVRNGYRGRLFTESVAVGEPPER
ncbi:C4-dicarboxylate ABC transporter [Prauserella marina]|uniref:C4-dicarboxylate transporter/malic acid transport protein n=1 Tax=Prauserella marina TaxID=530584 RepID=A0A222VWB6_9PSEU|nr:TDT family transporter [Prauserella marina]ASR38256.1 C4-dicarboxylate ABC transporter [Prauserella marina]PWV78549.1 C4-dicarboxylate transporter/malic acid transport protein [Prauserella marina]SDC88507.1 C4-dicarboxylate transporter/malic acid transport protein [Prauserella marina]